MIRWGLILLTLAIPGVARAIELTLPLDCALGETCHIQQFFDHDPGAGATDYTCGTLSYDGHDGTDFALSTLADQAAGVAVLAAAPGVVMGVRDEMPDFLQIGPDAPDITNRECGNGVVIRHEGGWETQYCHMRLGSILVAPGQEVATGTPLGQVGLSGQTQFPHVHLSVRHDGTEVDPFDPDETVTCGAPVGRTLWAEPVPYEPGGLIEVGFATKVPEFAAIKAGTAAETPLSSSDLVLWGFVFGGQTGDTLDIAITGPMGSVLAQSNTLERTQAQLFRAAGLRSPAGGWPAGDYVGSVSLTRNGTVIDTLTTRTTIIAE